MPDIPTASEIRDKVSTDLADGIQQVNDDGLQVTAMDPLKRLQALKEIEGREAENNPNFGLRFAKFIPGGTG